MIKVKLIFWEDGQRKERGRESKAILMPCKFAVYLIIRFRASRKQFYRAALE